MKRTNTRTFPALLVAFLSIPAALALVITDQTTDLPDGSICYKNGLTTTTCASGLLCELTQAPDEGGSFIYLGRCRAHTTPPPTCTVEHCSQYGANGVCTLDSNVVRCSAWAGSPDFPECPRCPDASNWNCASKSFLVSTGASYCTSCAVQTISCRNTFSVYGPLTPGGCFPYAPSDQNTCCRSKGAGCLQALDTCKTSLSGSWAATKNFTPCGSGLTCAASSVPSDTDVVDGLCVPSSKASRWCNIWTCSTEGADAVCSMPPAPGSSRRISGTCAAWAKRTDGGAKPDCAFECAGPCTWPRDNRPVTNTRVQYCSPCLIKRASCEASFGFWRDLTPSPALDASGYGCSATSPC